MWLNLHLVDVNHMYLIILLQGLILGFLVTYSGHGFSLETSIPRRTKPSGQGQGRGGCGHCLRLARFCIFLKLTYHIKPWGSGLEDEAFLSKGLGRQ